MKETPTRGLRGSTESSAHGMFGIMKDLLAFVRWINENTDHMVRVKVPVPKLPQTLFPVLSPEELQKIFSCKLVADNTELAKRNRALIAFMLDTGVRLSEVANLTPADFQLQEGQATRAPVVMGIWCPVSIEPRNSPRPLPTCLESSPLAADPSGAPEAPSRAAVSLDSHLPVSLE